MKIYIFFSQILFYGRVKVATKIWNQFAKFLKDMKVLLLEKVYVINVLGIFLSCFTTICASVATYI